MGITLFNLLTNSYPYTAMNPFILQRQLINDDPDLSSIIDEKLKDLLTKMLLKDPNERITIEKIIEHPWLTNDGKDAIVIH